MLYIIAKILIFLSYLVEIFIKKPKCEYLASNKGLVKKNCLKNGELFMFYN